jgi:hypothetical protein
MLRICSTFVTHACEFPDYDEIGEEVGCTGIEGR